VAEAIFDRSSHIQGGVWAQPDLLSLLMWSYSTHSVWNLRGSGGMPPPPENFEKLHPLRLNLRVFLTMFMSVDLGRQNCSKCFKCVPYNYILGMVKAETEKYYCYTAS